MKKLIALFLVTLTITGLMVFKYLTTVKEAEATFIPKKTICHVEKPDEGGVNQQTLTLPLPAALAHLSQHDADYEGECKEPEPVCETESWTCQECNDPITDKKHVCYKPQIKFCDSNFSFEDKEECEGKLCETVRVYDCEEPQPEPEPVPVPTPPQPLTQAGASIRTCSEIKYTPTVLGFKRLSPASVKVWWSKVDEHISQYVVYFGLNKDKLEWNTGVISGQEITLNDLPSGKHIWVAVQGSDNCGVGNLSEAIDP